MSRRNRGKKVTKAEDHSGDLNAFGGDNYTYRKDLTKRLDVFTGPFSQDFINELVLWKVDRYVAMTDLLPPLDELRQLKARQHRKARALLTKLLATPGVRLPMASTFLRFANPEVFQIIDRHAYRATYGTSFMAAVRSKSDKEQITLYFKYLDRLRKLAKERRFTFREADRILFIFDRNENPSLKETA
jgi:intergrase/recombinase